ncbi:DMT family transporter [Thermoanaerobacterium thermosaccharolyticum]|uniref:DMT family transporter n=1 Tax=Thermoanaerobacterium thermosaccharolyticum TaxID=1517 RepID=UPI003D2A5145
MNSIMLYVGAIIVGLALGLQSPMNSTLGKIALPKNSAVLNNLVGLIILVVISFADGSIRQFANLFKAPTYLLFGGILGSIIVLGSIILIPKLGAATFASIIVSVQMIAALLIDNFGLFGVEKTPIDWFKIMGVVLLIIGVRLIKA